MVSTVHGEKSPEHVERVRRDKMDENSIPKIPNLDLAQLLFLQKNGHDKKKEILALVQIDEMAPFYSLICPQLKWTPDTLFLKTLQEKNAAEIKRLEEKIVDAEANLGETDVSNALIEKAQYLAKIGDKEKSLTAYRLAFDKTGPLGGRIDIVFSILRIGFFFDDGDVVFRNIDKAKSLIDEGGDWDRRNRLKVYQGTYLMSIRNFSEASTMLLDTLATFTCTELYDYKTFVLYTTICAAITLNRPDFKQKVIMAPEVLEVIHEMPHLADYANSFYNCQYDKFFSALAALEADLKSDRYLFAHYKFYVREMRITIYNQLLQSYQSLTIESMAKSFGVSEDWIDSDLSKFISLGRVNAVIDKVGGVIETNRPDAKNAQYQSVIKQGDVLLNRIQKLSRVINV